ncbi:hypothetical protein GQ600_3554 [Phytophthora cactorum]|nr:hypothetical protein GQ600_3554 [Phytophthora cactorum]
MERGKVSLLAKFRRQTINFPDVFASAPASTHFCAHTLLARTSQSSKVIRGTRIYGAAHLKCVTGKCL